MVKGKGRAPKPGKTQGGKGPLGAGVRIDGADETQRALVALGPDAEAEFAKGAERVSNYLVGRIQAAGQGQGAQAALLAGTVRSGSKATPSITVGGGMGVGRHGTPADRLLAGSEFGHGKQGGAGAGTRNYAPHGFKPRASPGGLWIYPTLKAEGPAAARMWAEMADEIVSNFSDGS